MRTRASKIVMAIAIGFGGLALLIWSKMKIVGGVPRTAYAEQETDAAETTDATADRP